MSAFRRTLSKALFIATMLYPMVGVAQLPGGLPGGGSPGGGAEADLSCAGRGAEGKLGCGDIGLEETLDLCEDKDGDYICDDQDECLDTPRDTPVFINGCHMVELKEDQPLVLRGVNFEFNKATLTPDSTPILDQAVGVLNTQPDILVSIDGHTDSKGSDAYNRDLSRERAKAVYHYFVDAGVNRNRLIYRGFGESQPVSPNTLEDGSDNPAGRAENRRVELNIVDDETFAAIKEEIEEEEERLAAEQRAAQEARSRAEQQRREQTAEENQAAESEQAPEEAEASAGSGKAGTAAAEGGFDESEYLEFLGEEESGGEETSAPDEQAAEETDTQSGTSSSSAAPSGAEEQETVRQSADDKSAAGADSASEGSDIASDSEEFDESEYLEFLEEDAASEDTSGNTAGDGGATSEQGDSAASSEESEQGGQPAADESEYLKFLEEENADGETRSDSGTDEQADAASDDENSDYSLEVKPAQTQ